MHESKSTKILFAIIIVLLAGTGALGWYYFHVQAQNEKAAQNESQAEYNDLVKKQSSSKITAAISGSVANTNSSSMPTTSASTTTPDVAETKCASALSSDEKTATNGWTTYTNTTNKYSVKHPTGWTESGSDDNVMFRYDASSIIMNIKANATTDSLTNGLAKADSKNTTVACQTGTEITYSSIETAAVSTTFKKNNVSYIIMISFGNDYPTAIKDITESIELILKTLEFTN